MVNTRLRSGAVTKLSYRSQAGFALREPGTKSSIKALRVLTRFRMLLSFISNPPRSFCDRALRDVKEYHEKVETIQLHPVKAAESLPRTSWSGGAITRETWVGQQ